MNVGCLHPHIMSDKQWEQIQNYFREHDLELESIDGSTCENIFSASVRSLSRFSQTAKQALTSSSAFFSIWRMSPQHDLTALDFYYCPEEECATFTVIAHSCFVALKRDAGLLAQALEKESFFTHWDRRDNLLSNMLQMENKYEQCIYSSVLVDEDILQSLREDGEELSLFIESHSAKMDDEFLDSYERLITSLDMLSQYL